MICRMIELVFEMQEKKSGLGRIDILKLHEAES